MNSPRPPRVPPTSRRSCIVFSYYDHGPAQAPRSEDGLDATDDDLLGRPVGAVGGAALERGALVVEGELDRLRQVPVHRAGEGAGLARCLGRIGDRDEGGGVDAQLVVAGRDLDGADVALAGVERLVGVDA